MLLANSKDFYYMIHHLLHLKLLCRLFFGSNWHCIGSESGIVSSWRPSSGWCSVLGVCGFSTSVSLLGWASRRECSQSRSGPLINSINTIKGLFIVHKGSIKLFITLYIVIASVAFLEEGGGDYGAVRHQMTLLAISAHRVWTLHWCVPVTSAHPTTFQLRSRRGTLSLLISSNTLTGNIFGMNFPELGMPSGMRALFLSNFSTRPKTPRRPFGEALPVPRGTWRPPL